VPIDETAAVFAGVAMGMNGLATALWARAGAGDARAAVATRAATRAC